MSQAHHRPSKLCRASGLALARLQTGHAFANCASAATQHKCDGDSKQDHTLLVDKKLLPLSELVSEKGKPEAEKILPNSEIDVGCTAGCLQTRN